jgi:hypothetical protein
MIVGLNSFLHSKHIQFGIPEFSISIPFNPLAQLLDLIRGVIYMKNLEEL